MTQASRQPERGTKADELALLTTEQMYQADRLAMAGGRPGVELMAAAGEAVADAVRRHYPGARVLVLCGPGNNGGDGFVAARLLQEAGFSVTLALLGKLESLKGDAASHAALWTGPVLPFAVDCLDSVDLVVDAVFGAGLARPLEGPVRSMVEAMVQRRMPALAVDVPSGISGDSGAVVGDLAVRATHCVTFFRKKPGHLLLPGATHCGVVEVADIGIPASVLDEISPQSFENAPGLWAGRYPWRGPESHKYHFGHGTMVAGPLTGASILAARGALRVGAGLVSIACLSQYASIFATAVPSAMVRPIDEPDAWEALLAEARINALAIGPGAGVGPVTRERALDALGAGKRVVLDADALSSLKDVAWPLCDAEAPSAVLTPHEGEFRRLFADLEGDKPARARAAAARSGAAVVLKGADSVIAAPDGRLAINSNAPPELAIGGAGDVLTGLILGLLAQGMEPFFAAAAGAWIHGCAAQGYGPGLIAEDLPDLVPGALRILREERF